MMSDHSLTQMRNNPHISIINEILTRHNRIAQVSEITLEAYMDVSVNNNEKKKSSLSLK
jgi:hypothetical protein